MDASIANIGLGFLEGFALIISPCILPILPIILSGSLEGSKKRPIGIVIGFVLVFALFTFFSRKLVQYSGIDLNIVRHLSYGLLLLLGVVMMSTYLTDKFAMMTQSLANTGSSLSSVNNPQGGFVSGIFFGGLVALIWTPCAGPILAAVIVQTVIQQTSLASFLTVLAFGLGAALPMFIIALFGRKIMAKFGFFKTRTVLFRKILGFIIILSVGYMVYGETATTALAESTTGTSSARLQLQDGVLTPYQAPEISGITAWINSQPLELKNLRGKVVLIDFWTYSCINCIRTLPYVKEWYQKYHDKGLVIIGVHTPEFDFEKNLDNVKSAVAKDGILYPVALDSQFKTWQNFNNRYWPAHYLIDKNGYVVYQHFGEGEYDVTENNIRYLLGLKDQATANVPEAESTMHDESPETYLGYARAQNFSSPQPVTKDLTGQYAFPDELPMNGWALQGAWDIASDRVTSMQSAAELKYHFNAKKVFMVMGSKNNKPVKVTVMLNGEKLIHDNGKDVSNGVMTVDKHALYEVVNLSQAGSGVLQINASSPGLEVYTFTFGG